MNVSTRLSAFTHCCLQIVTFRQCVAEWHTILNALATLIHFIFKPMCVQQVAFQGLSFNSCRSLLCARDGSQATHGPQECE
jgi:hypothetical protein